jgi:hypothetical protein
LGEDTESPCNGHATVTEAWSRRVAEPGWADNTALGHDADGQVARLSLGAISSALGSMIGSLHAWKAKSFPSIPRELKKLRAELDTLA